MLAHRERLEHAGLLRRDAHHAFSAHRLRDGIDAKYGDRAGGWPQLRGYLTEESRFAGSVGAQNGDYFATPHVQVDSAINLDAGRIKLNQVPDRNRWKGFLSSA